MPVIVSSQVAHSGALGLLNLIGSSGSVQFFDTNGVYLGTLPLQAAPGFAVGGMVVFAGMPSNFTASSGAPVGAQPATFSVIVSGSTIISGLSVSFAQSVAALDSSSILPGGTVNVGAIIVSSGVL